MFLENSVRSRENSASILYKKQKYEQRSLKNEEHIENNALKKTEI